MVTSPSVLTDSTNSGENLYTLINSVPPGGNRSSVSYSTAPDVPVCCMDRVFDLPVNALSSVFVVSYGSRVRRPNGRTGAASHEWLIR